MENHNGNVQQQKPVHRHTLTSKRYDLTLQTHFTMTYNDTWSGSNNKNYTDNFEYGGVSSGCTNKKGRRFHKIHDFIENATNMIDEFLLVLKGMGMLVAKCFLLLAATTAFVAEVLLLVKAVTG